MSIYGYSPETSGSDLIKKNKQMKIAMSIENLFGEIYTDSNAQQCPGRFIMAWVNFTF